MPEKAIDVKENEGIVVKNGKEFYTRNKMFELLEVNSYQALWYKMKKKSMPRSTLYRTLYPKTEIDAWMAKMNAVVK